MFMGVDSLGLLQRFFETSAFIRSINTFGMTLFHSFFFNALAFFLYSILLATLYQKKPNYPRHALTSLACCLLSQGPIFLIAIFRPPSITFHIEDLFAVNPPYYVVMIYALCAYGLQIEKHLAAITAYKMYIVLILILFVYYALEALFFFLLSNDPRFQVIIYLLANTLMQVVHLVLCTALIRYIRKHKFWLDANKLKSSMTKSVSAQLGVYTFYAVLLYLICVSNTVTASRLSNIAHVELMLLTMALACGLIFWVTYMRDVRAIARIDARNQTHHIRALVSAIDEFRTVKHDMNNMMQGYEGFIHAKDWPSLEAYHAALFNETSRAGNLLTLNLDFEKNPALFSILNAKIQDAREKGVFISAALTANAGDIGMEPVDLARVVGILLDNAVEETLTTDSKTVTLSLQTTRRGKILLSISNPTASDVDIRRMFERNYSSKKDHSGLGLYTLWSIVSRTQECRLNVEYLNHIITFYLELPTLSSLETA